jgi:hypothetical protein
MKRRNEATAVAVATGIKQGKTVIVVKVFGKGAVEKIVSFCLSGWARVFHDENSDAVCR